METLEEVTRVNIYRQARRCVHWRLTIGRKISCSLRPLVGGPRNQISTSNRHNYQHHAHRRHGQNQAARLSQRRTDMKNQIQNGPCPKQRQAEPLQSQLTSPPHRIRCAKRRGHGENHQVIVKAKWRQQRPGQDRRGDKPVESGAVAIGRQRRHSQQRDCADFAHPPQ